MLGLVAGLDTRSFNDRVALISCPPIQASGSLEHKLKMEKIKLVLNVIVYIYVFWRFLNWLRNQLKKFSNGLKSTINIFAKKFDELDLLHIKLNFSKFKDKKNSSSPILKIDD